MIDTKNRIINFCLGDVVIENNCYNLTMQNIVTALPCGTQFTALDTVTFDGPKITFNLSYEDCAYILEQLDKVLMKKIKDFRFNEYKFTFDFARSNWADSVQVIQRAVTTIKLNHLPVMAC